MSKMQIDADEHEAIRRELSGRQSNYEDDASTITGIHEDLGRVTLRREAGVFTVEADDTSFVRAFGVARGEGGAVTID